VSLVYDSIPVVSEKLKSYVKKSLCKSNGEYHENFWESGNAIPLGSREKKLIEKLVKNLKAISE